MNNLKLLLAVCLCPLLIGNAKAKKSLFIYIDPSSIIEQRMHLLNTLEERVRNIDQYDDFMIFISNMETPIIITDTNNIGAGLYRLLSIRPSGPKIDMEIDTLITALLPIIDERERDEIECLFYFNESSCWSQQYIHNFVNLLALSLGMKDKWKDQVDIWVDGSPERLRQRHQNSFLNLRITQF